MTHANNDAADRLSRIETHWSLVRQAHKNDDPNVATARQQLLMQYATAIRRYLGAALRDDDAADDVFQEFAVSFSRGDFRNADPNAGRFRQYIKTALYHQIAGHYRKLKKQPTSLTDESSVEAQIDEAIQEADEALRIAWRDELLNAAWTRLQENSRKKQSSSYDILRIRSENPHFDSDQLAEHVSTTIGKTMTSAATRTALHRARHQFADCLLQALAESLDSDELDVIEDELGELRLMEYCRQALDERRLDQSD